MSIQKNMFWRIVLMLICATIVVACVLRPWETRLAVVPLKKGQVLAFQLQMWNVNSIIRVDIWSASSDELLWSCKPRSRQITEIIYGECPSTGEQIFPGDGRPRRFRPLESVILRIDYQYDIAGATAAARDVFFSFRVAADGSTREFHEVDSAIYPSDYVVRRKAN